MKRKSFLGFEDSFHLSPLVRLSQGSHTFISLLSIPFLQAAPAFNYFLSPFYLTPIAAYTPFSIQCTHDSRIYGHRYSLLLDHINHSVSPKDESKCIIFIRLPSRMPPPLLQSLVCHSVATVFVQGSSELFNARSKEHVLKYRFLLCMCLFYFVFAVLAVVTTSSVLALFLF